MRCSRCSRSASPVSGQPRPRPCSTSSKPARPPLRPFGPPPHKWGGVSSESGSSHRAVGFRLRRRLLHGRLARRPRHRGGGQLLAFRGAGQGIRAASWRGSPVHDDGGPVRRPRGRAGRDRAAEPPPPPRRSRGRGRAQGHRLHQTAGAQRARGAREAHSGPHAEHFWDAETAGGGALLDMGCHTVEAARYFFGKQHKIKDVFAWGATMVHNERTTGEDNAVLLLRLEDGRTSLTEASWTAKGGMELRNEVYGTMGRIVTDTSSTRVRAFIQKPAGYLMEKADADVGWVFPIPDEARVYGYHEEMRHFVECFVKGEQPREDFVDGYIVNSVLDAAYESMRSGHWEAVHVDSKVAG